ncbi:hypothetical protein D3C75_1156150 [compost metagenome]
MFRDRARPTAAQLVYSKTDMVMVKTFESHRPEAIRTTYFGVRLLSQDIDVTRCV